MNINFLPALFSLALLLACNTNHTQKQASSINIKGTWKLASSTTSSKGIRTVIDFTKDQSMIKIINDTHFAFLKHDLKINSAGKNNFDAGGGRYKLEGNQYTEHLDYYNDKNWEGKTFTFTVQIKNDTLIQTGIEKVDEAGIDREITEKYIKINN